MSRRIPISCDVLVAGGGPAGSTAAALLAASGLAVVLVERDTFPRYHIGESLLPSVLKILEILGVRGEVERYGFVLKAGACLSWGRDPEPWFVRFGQLSGEYTYSFQVIRSEFDDLLLKHAGRQGVDVHQRTEVADLEFEDGRPVAATVRSLAGDHTQRISFSHFIDATGRYGLIANRYLKNRRMHTAFRNVAVWAYWDDASRLPGEFAGAIATIAVKDGWIWAIPLHDSTMSVGAVLHKAAFAAAKTRSSVRQVYLDALRGAPVITDLLAGARMREAAPKVETDYSYAAAVFSGPGYFMTGDSACFIDPILSSGVHLAMYSALLAAASIASVRAGSVTDMEAQLFFDAAYRKAYLRFMVFLSQFLDQSHHCSAHFRLAQQLNAGDLEPSDVRQAFVDLISGLQDYRDLDLGTVPQLALHRMNEMVRQNLELERTPLNSTVSDEWRREAHENEVFFNSVRGLGALNEPTSGFQLSLRPALRLVPTPPPSGSGIR